MRHVAVVARPDRAQGKHLRIEPGPVASLAAQLGFPLHQPENVNDNAFIAQLAALERQNAALEARLAKLETPEPESEGRLARLGRRLREAWTAAPLRQVASR